MLIRKRYSGEEFTAKRLSAELVESLVRSMTVATSPYILKHVTSKRISNDLRRLWQMGFLKRTPYKRWITPEQRRPRNLGIEYRYSLLKRAYEYPTNRANPELVRIKHEETWKPGLEKELDLKMWLGRDIPNDAFDNLIMLCFKRGGRYKRFPVRFGPTLAIKYAAARRLLRQRQVYDIQFELEFENLKEKMTRVFPHLKQTIAMEDAGPYDFGEDDMRILKLFTLFLIESRYSRR